MFPQTTKEKLRRKKVEKMQLITGIVGAVFMASIFIMYTIEHARHFFEATLKLVMFPLIMCVDVVQTAFAWGQCYINHFKERSLILHAVVETLSTAAIVSAVIGAFIAPTTFAVVTPIVFVTTSSFKAFYNLGVFFYHAYEFLGRGKGASERTIASIGVDHIFISSVFACNAIAIGLMLIAGQFMFGVMGSLVSILVIGFSMRKLTESKDNKFVETTIVSDYLVELVPHPPVPVPELLQHHGEVFQFRKAVPSELILSSPFLEPDH